MSKKNKESSTGRSFDGEKNVPLDVYFNENYFAFPALSSMCEQIITIHRCEVENLLEIGKGNGFVSDFLKKSGIAVTTLDINPALEPDICGSATDMDTLLKGDKFDWVLCAEVLEHVPFAMAKEILKQIAATAREGAVITVPKCQRILFNIQGDVTLAKVPFFKGKGKKIDWFCSKRGKSISQCHHWEIGHTDETTMKSFVKVLEEDFEVRESWRFRHCPYHQFFVLKPLKEKI